ncbi:MAG: DUF2103 domain-containing protein [Candidatus Aenigmarchaeota archaeon]|nr:DUF2103 domain-containing protein [Candidatus Aenigmarchaeota archaeon]
MKHRAKRSKIKYEHDMIHGLRSYLEEELEPLEYVTTIIPGRIKRRKGVSSFEVQFRYSTPTGAKLLAYGPGVVQEVFVVTDNPEALKEKLSLSKYQLRLSATP